MLHAHLEFVLVAAQRRALFLPEVVRLDDARGVDLGREVLLQHLEDGLDGGPGRLAALAAHVQHGSEAALPRLIAVNHTRKPRSDTTSTTREPETLLGTTRRGACFRAWLRTWSFPCGPANVGTPRARDSQRILQSRARVLQWTHSAQLGGRSSLGSSYPPCPGLSEVPRRLLAGETPRQRGFPRLGYVQPGRLHSASPHSPVLPQASVTLRPFRPVPLCVSTATAAGAGA